MNKEAKIKEITVEKTQLEKKVGQLEADAREKSLLVSQTVADKEAIIGNKEAKIKEITVEKTQLEKKVRQLETDAKLQLEDTEAKCETAAKEIAAKEANIITITSQNVLLEGQVRELEGQENNRLSNLGEANYSESCCARFLAPICRLCADS